jgi:hypothetical protein
MRYAVSFFLFLMLITSCQSEKILYDNVVSLTIEIDERAPSNTGTEFDYTLFAELKSGESKKVKNDAIISFPEKTVSDKGNHSVQINTPLSDFTYNEIPIQITLEIGEYRVVSNDSVQLNFRAPIAAIWETSKGEDAVQPRESSSTLFGRDGLTGKPGNVGKDGENGRHFTGYLWEETSELRMLLICDSTNEQFCYRSLRRDTITIDLSGGDAGNGSMGGKGGNGKNAKTGKLPGNGGDGGIGGNGGNGGDGGSLIMFVHPDVAFLKYNIHLTNSGGTGGASGIGGAPGKAGEEINDQVKATDGVLGKSGSTGKNGKQGPTLTVSIVKFDSRRIIR